MGQERGPMGGPGRRPQRKPPRCARRSPRQQGWRGVLRCRPTTSGNTCSSGTPAPSTALRAPPSTPRTPWSPAPRADKVSTSHSRGDATRTTSTCRMPSRSQMGLLSICPPTVARVRSSPASSSGTTGRNPPQGPAPPTRPESWRTPSSSTRTPCRCSPNTSSVTRRCVPSTRHSISGCPGSVTNPGTQVSAARSRSAGSTANPPTRSSGRPRGGMTRRNSSPPKTPQLSWPEVSRGRAPRLSRSVPCRGCPPRLIRCATMRRQARTSIAWPVPSVSLLSPRTNRQDRPPSSRAGSRPLSANTTGGNLLRKPLVDERRGSAVDRGRRDRPKCPGVPSTVLNCPLRARSRRCNRARGFESRLRAGSSNPQVPRPPVRRAAWSVRWLQRTAALYPARNLEYRCSSRSGSGWSCRRVGVISGRPCISWRPWRSMGPSTSWSRSLLI